MILEWWILPILIVIVGYVVSYVYYKINYSPSGYFGDFITPFVSLVLFFIFVAIAVGIVIGKFLN